MTIQVVTDSTADLPTQTAKDYNITVVPLYINIEGKSYPDGVELSRQEFYQRLPDLKSPPLTSAPGPEIFRQVYEKLAAQGATEVLSLHISASLSATYNIAQAAAQTSKAVPVTTFDPGQLTLGTGLLVIEAAKAAAAGQSAVFFALRLLLQLSLFQEQAAQQLALIHVITGWPATVALLVVSYLYGAWRLQHLKGPSVEEFRAGDEPPWTGQQRGF